MAFSASIVHVSFSVAVLVLFATTAAGPNATVITDAIATAVRRSTLTLPASASAAPNGSLQYVCYLCRKRNTLMIRWCPLVEDDCHIACLSLPTPSPPTPPHAVAAAGDGDGNQDDDDCYVMKLYPDGSWVVVDVVSCRAAAGCYLVCSHGDAREEDVMARTSPATPPGGPPLPMPNRLADFERCGDQFKAPGAAASGV